MKDTIKAIEYAQKAKAISIKSKLLYGVSESLQQLIKVDIKNASKNAEEYIKVNNSMQNTERQFRNKFARIAYETDEIQQEKEQAIKQKWIISGIAAFVFLIGLLLFIITKQRSKQKELLLLQSQQKANEEIYQLMLTQKTTEETARQTEKKRIALELHDGIMNKLASTRLNLFVLSKKTDTATIEKCLTHISDIYTIEQEIRSIAHDLNQDVFKEANSFISLLKDFIAEQNTTSNSKYKLELQHDINWIAISSEIKMNLYRIIQEASHNINKYSKAKNVVVSIIQDGYNVCMSITDDGVGFDTSIINDGIGIKNMQQRIKSLNGKFTINSTQKNSTSINLSIPIG
jgi:signal transduction histidine kinase